MISLGIWTLLLLGFCAITGCESISINDKDLSDYIPTTSTTIPDQLVEFKWLGQNFSGAQIDGSEIRSASIDERFTYQDYMLKGWKTIQMGSAKVNAIICLGYERNGKVIGKFDWMRSSGQPVKTLENVHHGYNGHTMPIKGQNCWLMLVSVDGKYRTNLIKLTWK